MVLSVRNTTCTVGVYGELGRYPLFISRYIRIIKYWFKLLYTDNIILRSVYQLALNDCNKGLCNWVTYVKKLLCDYGFIDVWNNPYIIDFKNFIPVFRQRIIDCFIQGWHVSKESSSVLDLYNVCKLNFYYAEYLDLMPTHLRRFITRLRTSAHSLRIQTGRYARNRIQRNERYCQCCSVRDLEDEFHFIFICPCYSSIRSIYIKRYYFVNPSMFKFIALLQSKNRNELCKLAVYYKNAMTIRNSIINYVQ
jgi:hypothetical protein